MTIWRTLLFSSLAVSLLPSAVLTLLAFVQARKALEAEIARTLLVQASAVMAQIDWMLFEQIENVRTWTQLDVMQEIRIGDIDKRISQALTGLKAGYGVYDQIFCTAADGKVVAASDPHLLGQRVFSRPPWLTTTLPGGTVFLEPLSFSPPFQEAHLRIRAPVSDTFQQGEMLGTLYALFDWTQIFRILDRAEYNSTADSRERMAILLDRDGRIIAASSFLRQQGLLLSPILASWSPVKQVRQAGSGIVTADGHALGAREVLVGYAHSQGYQSFSGFGWSTLVVQPTAQAFLPIWRMGLTFLVLLALTGAVAAGVSLLIASRIARPILRLADFTRRFARQGTASEPPPTGSGEIGELSRAFIQMMQDLERSREDLVRAAKLAVVGEMAAVLAHEIRTPLGILRSSAQMLQREPQLNSEAQEMVGFIISETDRLNRLVSTLLNFARPRPPVFHPQDIHTILRRAIDMLAQRAERKGIRIVTELKADPSTLFCDGEQMMQVFLNLLLNPLQILPARGEIAVRTAEENDWLVIEVADNGPGIPPENRQRVFDPFFTTREGGIGLGLTVVQQIVKTHGGDISAHENPGGGACFRLFLSRERSPEG